MSVSTIYVPHGMLLPTSAFLCQLDNGRISSGLIPSTQFASGHPQPLALHAHGIRPAITFSTKQLATLLTATGVFGYSHSGGSSDIVFYLKKAADLGVRVADATTEHLRYVAEQGLLTWNNISVGQDSEAMAQCAYVPTYDGTNAPLIPAGAVALSGTPTAAEVFTLGPVKFNGTAISGVESWSLDLGNAMYQIAADGEPYLSFLGVQQIEPVLTIRGVNAVAQLTYGLAGTAIASSWSVALKRMATDGGHVANGTSSHIVIAGTVGTIEPTDVSGNGNAPMQSEIRVRLRAPNAAGNALGITIATTIS